LIEDASRQTEFHHSGFDLRGSIPAFIRVTIGDTHDVHMLDQILPEPGAFYKRGCQEKTLFLFREEGMFF
jgi:hypothetical protein